MADVSLGDLGSSSSPLAGLDASDYAGYGSGGNQSSPLDMSNSSMLGAGMLGAGALGIGALMAQGPGQLPGQFLQAEGQVPGMQAEASTLEGQGGGMVAQGQSALAMAQAGQLTPEQQAQLNQYQTGLTNQSRQQWAAMGRNPDQDTSFISQTGNIDTQVNAMAQQQIQTTIQLGLGEISSGSSLIGQGSGIENASNQILLAAGQAQVQQDQAYSSSLTSAFTAIAGMAAKAAPMLLAA
jgi:hypothetical protein